jgi:hypothetical protein
VMEEVRQAQVYGVRPLGRSSRPRRSLCLRTSTSAA